MNRTEILREDMYTYRHQRHWMFFQNQWDTVDMPCSLAERKAYALKNMLENMPIFIEDHELIVGSRTAYKTTIKNDNSVLGVSNSYNAYAFPRYLKPEEKTLETAGIPWLIPVHEGHSKGHCCADYGKVMKYGLRGIIQEAENGLDQQNDPEKRAFLKSVIISYQATVSLVLRYRDLALETADKTSDKQRHNELNQIADVCQHISEKAPETFQQALQLYWFAHLVIMVENQALMTFGRFDQHLISYWQDGSEENTELLHCFMIKLNDHINTGWDANAINANLIIGGVDRNGCDVTNPLSYACLDAIEQIKLPNPMLAVRVHQQTPSAFWQRVCQLLRQGMGQVALYNDDTFIPALQKAGFPIEDARNYILDACQDILIEGKSDFYMAGQLRLTELLLEFLNNSDSDVKDFKTFISGYKRTISEALGRVVADYQHNSRLKSLSPLPFLSGTMTGCIPKGQDITNGGLHYNDKGIMVMSPVNAVNSLAALKDVVFDKKLYTLTEVKQALSANFATCKDLHAALSAAPKWGNDDDFVDGIAKDILDFSCREITKHRIDKHSRFLSGIHQPHQVDTGSRAGATPDGRFAGQPYPVTLSPVNGTAKHGPTAIFKSVTKLDPDLCQWNHALCLTLQPSCFKNEDGLNRLVVLLKTYMQLGGPQLQINMVDTDTLKDAKQHPDKYRDLVVRVWGFCARFIELPERYQDEIIARESLSL